MAALYGSLTGRGKAVTREGTKASGIEAWVQTWDARVTVALGADGTCRITATSPQRSGSPVMIFHGNIEDAVREGGGQD